MVTIATAIRWYSTVVQTSLCSYEIGESSSLCLEYGNIKQIHRNAASSIYCYGRSANYCNTMLLVITIKGLLVTCYHGY